MTNMQNYWEKAKKQQQSIQENAGGSLPFGTSARDFAFLALVRMSVQQGNKGGGQHIATASPPCQTDILFKIRFEDIITRAKKNLMRKCQMVGSHLHSPEFFFFYLFFCVFSMVLHGYKMGPLLCFIFCFSGGRALFTLRTRYQRRYIIHYILCIIYIIIITIIITTIIIAQQ